MRTTLVIAYKPGQLANRLLQFATFIAFSEATGTRIVNPSFDEYARFFPATEGDLLVRYPGVRSRLPRSPRIRRGLYWLVYYLTRVLLRSGIASPLARALFLDWEERRFLDESFRVEIGRSRLAFVQGWRYMMPLAVPFEYCGPPGGIEPHAEAIRRHLAPGADITAEATALVEEARLAGTTLVGVHIRQGDFLTDKNQGRYYYTAQQYATKMREVVDAHRPAAVSFLICSDGPQPREAFAGLPCAFSGRSALVDMYALARCDRILGPPSSFSLWASFYGDVPFCWIFDLRDPVRLESFRSFAPIDQDEYAERFHGYVGAKRGSRSPP